MLLLLIPVILLHVLAVWLECKNIFDSKANIFKGKKNFLLRGCYLRWCSGVVSDISTYVHQKNLRLNTSFHNPATLESHGDQTILKQKQSKLRLCLYVNRFEALTSLRNCYWCLTDFFLFMVSLFYSTMSLRRFGCVRSCWQVRNLEYLTPSKLKTMRQIQLPVPHMDWPLCTRQKSAWKPSDWLNKLHRYSCDILGQLCQWYLLRNRIQFYKTVLRGCNVWMYDEYSLIFYSVRQSVCWLVHHTFYGACIAINHVHIWRHAHTCWQQ